MTHAVDKLGKMISKMTKEVDEDLPETKNQVFMLFEKRGSNADRTVLKLQNRADSSRSVGAISQCTSGGTSACSTLERPRSRARDVPATSTQGESLKVEIFQDNFEVVSFI